MFDLQKVYFKNIQKALSKETWRKDAAENTKGGSWLGTIVGRRLLHRHLLRTGQQELLNSTEISPVKRAAVLRLLASASKQVPAGSVIIEGKMSDMRMSDWMDLEISLIKQILVQSPKIKIKPSEVLYRLHPRSDCPAVIRGLNPGWKSLVNSKSLAPIPMLVGLITSMLFAFNGEMSGAIVATVGSALSIGYAKACDFIERVSTGDLVEKAGELISSTWDEVFAMRTEMDAVLLGALYGVITHGREDNPELPIPDFLEMTPYQAYAITTKVLDEAGKFNDKVVSKLFDAVADVKKHHTEPDSGIVEGFDLRAFQCASENVVNADVDAEACDNARKEPVASPADYGFY